MTHPVSEDEKRHDDTLRDRALPHDHEEDIMACIRGDGCVVEIACARLRDCALSLAKPPY